MMGSSLVTNEARMAGQQSVASYQPIQSSGFRRELLQDDFNLRGLGRFDREILEYDVLAHVVAVGLDAVRGSGDKPGVDYISLRVGLRLAGWLIPIGSGERNDLGGER